jgi:hypothetical protein
MRVCLIAEKFSVASLAFPHILELHPDLERDAFACAFVNGYTHLNARFRYPRGLSFSDYPFTGEAAYEPFSFETPGLSTTVPRLAFHRHEPDDGSFLIDYRFPTPKSREPDPGVEAARRFRAADVVYAVVDPCPSSTLALDRCLRWLALDASRVAIPRLRDLAGPALRKAFASPSLPGEAWYAAHVAQAVVRRRFDYGYQVNALAIHGRAMRLAGAVNGAQVPSKYGLQALYDMRRKPPMPKFEWMDGMERWKGTGRYADARGGLASYSSREPILEALKRSGLAREIEGALLTISPLGHRFLEILHPDSEDRDLPFRMEGWKMDPDGNARVDRYLRTFFGRQIRHQARRIGFSAEKGMA